MKRKSIQSQEQLWLLKCKLIKKLTYKRRSLLLTWLRNVRYGT